MSNPFYGFIKPLSVIFIAILIFGCSSESKTLSVKPSSFNFENVNIDDTVYQEITLTNKYSKEIQISTINLSGSNDFTIAEGGSAPVQLIAKAEHVIKIAFNPKSAGAAYSILEIEHDGSTRLKSVTFEGIGVPVARISVPETAYDFGKKAINKSFTRDFVVENNGSDVLKVNTINISGIGASGYSITAGDAPFDVAVGSIHTFTLTFSPIVAGPYQTELLISHNAVNGDNPVKIAIDGEGVILDPRITLSIGTTSWDYGDVFTTIPSTEICEIENTGIDPLLVSSAALTNNVEFNIVALKDSNGNNLNFPQTVAVGSKIFLSVEFAPTAAAQYTDTLSIEHDGTNEFSPLNVPITGNGKLITNKTFTYTGAVQTFTVPAGVTSIIVECYGAQGGDSAGGKGGKGGMAGATITVTPGETLNIYVGQMGFLSTKADPGGWNGGGGVNASGQAGTGGGASDIRRGTALSDRLIVAGAGGGGGYLTRSGGGGGGLSGQDAPDISPNWPYSNGKGGTQTAGGAAGYYTNGTAEPGTFGLGGRGKGDGAGGGGGGGGWYGGGGGQFTGAGGGSSYYDASGNTNKSTQAAVRSGNGEINIKW